MVAALLDTNILIDQLLGVAAATEELARYDEPAISLLTWIEVLVGATPSEELRVRSFLDDFEVVGVDQDVAEEAAQLRRSHRMKLPDAIIWASARVQGRLLVTRNTKDFPSDDPGVRVPYTV
jgi:predicted nucleic acid-binding protein